MKGFGQLIQGKVLDQETREPIDFASVYFDGTFVGTTTDSLGNFEIDITKYSSRSLTVSAVGFYSESIATLTSGEIHRVELIPRIFSIEEVSVSTQSLVRKRRACMRLFKREFIGLTSNARRCYILNEQDISFNYGSDQDTLRAYASKPLRIQNLSLGYVFTYHLDCFEYARKTHTMRYNGSIVFNRDLAADEASLKRYSRRRAYAYTGSSKHFFRALWTKTLQSEGFAVSGFISEKRLMYKHLVFEDLQGRKYIQYLEDLMIQYYPYQSYINFLNEKVYFEKDGFFDPTAILWTGTMSKQRIADFLPYEYIIPE
jgi:hypothetical protein